jgi:hypothetical protein
LQPDAGVNSQSLNEIPVFPLLCVVQQGVKGLTPQGAPAEKQYEQTHRTHEKMKDLPYLIHNVILRLKITKS